VQFQLIRWRNQWGACLELVGALWAVMIESEKYPSNLKVVSGPANGYRKLMELLSVSFLLDFNWIGVAH
jgi:hypothetical protein